MWCASVKLFFLLGETFLFSEAPILQNYSALKILYLQNWIFLFLPGVSLLASSFNAPNSACAALWIWQSTKVLQKQSQTGFTCLCFIDPSFLEILALSVLSAFLYYLHLCIHWLLEYLAVLSEKSTTCIDVQAAC